MKKSGRKLNKSRNDLVFASTPTGPTEPPIIITKRKEFLKLFFDKDTQISKRKKKFT